MEIADALLNQQVMAGIGNVYKSEVLFACGVNPFARVAALSDERLTQLIETGAKIPEGQRVRQPVADDDLHRLPPHDATRRSVRAAVGLRSRPAAVPEVRNADQRARPGTGRAPDLLVSDVSGWIGGARSRLRVRLKPDTT